MSEYRITLKNCTFFARHGVYSEEQALGQRFHVDAVLTVEAGDALETDDIAGTVDYGKAYQVIDRVVMGKQRYLIEALAFEAARTLLEAFSSVRRAEITIRKPNAPVAGVLDHVEVTVVRERGAGEA